jgi:hypothetical protein
MMIRIKTGLGIWVAAVVGLLSFAISADVVMDEPVWPVLKPEYLDRELRHGEWDWALHGFDEVPQFSVARDERYGAYFTLNGKPFYPLWGWVKSQHRHDQLPSLGSIELDLQTMFLRQHKWWPRGTEINTEVFERVAEQNFRVNTNSYFMLEIDLYPPKDFIEEFPDEMCRDDKGNINRDDANGINYSFASEVAARRMENVLKRVINFVENRPWGRRIAGYRINSGTTLEWLHWYRGGIVDFSKPCREGFERFCRKHYPEIKDFSIPSQMERSASDGDMLLWNAKDHLRVVAWHEYVSEMVSTMLIRMCTAAKSKLAELGRRKLVGTYYGYVVNAPGYGDRQRYGHYALKRVIESRAVDFLLSPPEYSTRTPGNAMIDMKPYATLSANGIVSVVENDIRTAHSAHLRPPVSAAHQAPTHELSLSHIRRNLAVSLCRNQPLSLFDIFSGVAYDFPESRRDIALMRALGKYCMEKRAKRSAEVAIVVSEKAVTSLAATDRAPCRMALVEPFQRYRTDGTVETVRFPAPVPWYDTHMWNMSRWGRAGAPVDYVLAEELDGKSGDYKLYVFPNAWKYDESLASSVAKLRERNCTIIWFYAPGFVSVDGNSVEGMDRLTGMRFERIPGKIAAELQMSDGRKMGVPDKAFEPMFRCVSEGGDVFGRYANGDIGAVSLVTGNARSVFCGTWRPDVRLLAEVERLAGVHRFCETDDPVEANSNLVTLHARRAGRKTLKLPGRTDVIDVFERKVVAFGVDSFSFDADLHSSHLFYYGDDATEVLEMLKGVKWVE